MFVDSCDNWGNKPFNFRYVGQRFEKQLLWLISPEWENRIFVHSTTTDEKRIDEHLACPQLVLYCQRKTTLMRHYFSGLSLHETYQTLGPPCLLLYWCSGISNDAKKTQRTRFQRLVPTVSVVTFEPKRRSKMWRILSFITISNLGQ